MAKQDAKIIAKWLLEQPIGTEVRKAYIVNTFNLPHNKASLVFVFLEQWGFVVKERYIVVSNNDAVAKD